MIVDASVASRGVANRPGREAVCRRPDGHPDFRAFRSRQACREARLMAFNLLSS
jgi:hypothetical protein